MKYHTVIFDFDGTIADTEKIFLETINALASEFGFAPVRLEEVPELRKMSARRLLVERLHVPLWNIWKIYKLEKRGKELFTSRVAEVQVFSGMKELMEQLRRAGCRVGVVSSNGDGVVAKVLQTATIPVDFMHGGSRAFGKARALKNVLAGQGIDPATTLYVGDEVRDVEACRKVGIDVVAVSWGYNDAQSLREAGAEVVRDRDALLKKIIET